MRTYPLLDGSGAIFAFEIDNIAVSPRELERLVIRELGATVTFGPQGFFSREDARLRFVVSGIEFEVNEPFGDNSRYWIGPSGPPPRRVAEIDKVRVIFESYKAGILRRLISIFGV